jgi:hypothetical protein
MKSVHLIVALATSLAAVGAESRHWTFDDLPLNATPPGWKTMTATTSGAPLVTGDGRPTVEYRVVANTGVPGAVAANRVVRVDNTKTTDYGAGHHLWTDALAFRDGTIECLIMAEDTLKGNGGLSFRIRDHRTFYAVRLQLSGEPGIMLFKVKDGIIVRTEAKAKGTPVLGAGRWVRLSVMVADAHLRVAVDGKEYLNFTDTNDPILGAGGVGLFARGNESIIGWDNLKVVTP